MAVNSRIASAPALHRKQRGYAKNGIADGGLKSRAWTFEELAIDKGASAWDAGRGRDP